MRMKRLWMCAAANTIGTVHLNRSSLAVVLFFLFLMFSLFIFFLCFFLYKTIFYKVLFSSPLIVVAC